MPHASMPVSAFYELDGPPQALPLLTYQTEMFCPSSSFILITPQEEMSFSPPTLMGCTPSCVFTNMSFHSTTPITSHQPMHKVVKSVSFSAVQITPSLESVTKLACSSLSSIGSSESKIPKPEGEVGRPGHGSYSLETALNWDAKRFKKLKDCVHKSIQKHCNTSKSKKHQDSATLDIVKNEALACFSELQDYEGCWPVGDIIQMQLTNTSAKERQRKK
ncbi:hypothetical protein BD769DRAFT_1678604 [Suillus cothurnatus]|nr:hypothetical protein BD769DRAFT_1678604 [Suillus cothurnatus]